MSSDRGSPGLGQFQPTDEQIASFVQLTNCDEQHARFLLEATNGNVEAALSHLYDHSSEGHGGHAHGTAGGFGAAGADRARAAGTSGRPLPPRPRAPVGAPGITGRAPAAPALNNLGLVGNLLRLPFVVVRTGVGVLSTAISFSFTVAALIGDKVLPAPIMRTVRSAAAAFTGHGEDIDPAQQAQRFIQSYKAAYGDRHPRFIEASIRQATTQAKSEYKFLMVYLHSPEHQDTDKFCSDVLGSPELVTYANQHFVSWGGDVRYTDAYQLSGRLGVTAYPYVALLNTALDNRVQLIAAVQGLLPAEQLLAVMVRSVEEQGALLVAQRAELMERENDRLLREQQNAEYEQSLAADREREARREEERRKAEAEQRAREEEEARQQAAQQAEEKRKADKVNTIQRRREEKRASLPPEATPGQGVATALVRVRLPDGANTQRCFQADHLVQHVFDLVDSLDSTTFLSYNLSSNYPRKVFTQADGHVTLEAAGLTPNATLFVQPQDDE